VFCARCGEQIPDASETCPLCGRETTLRIDAAPLSHPVQTQSATPNFYYAGSGVQGVGGWLLFFCLILTLASPVIVFAQIAAQPHGPNSYNLIDVARVLYGVVVGIILWMQRRIAIQLVGVYFIVVLATIVLVLLIFLAAWTRTKSPFLLGRGIGSILPSVIHNVLWFLYFRKSERVRNTYGANL
jgi:hypothetical protein